MNELKKNSVCKAQVHVRGDCRKHFAVLCALGPLLVAKRISTAVLSSRVRASVILAQKVNPARVPERLRNLLLQHAGHSGVWIHAVVILILMVDKT